MEAKENEGLTPEQIELSQIIKFSDGKEPKSNDFSDLIDSFEHKSIPIAQSRILDLAQSFDKKADKTQVEAFAVGLIYKPAMPNVAALTSTYPNAQKGWAAKVMDQTDPNGNAYIYQFDGLGWSNTGLIVFPDNVATKEELNDVSNDVDEIKNELGFNESTPCEIIPYSVGNAETNNSKQWFYLNPSILVGKTVTGVKVNFKKAGTFTVVFGKGLNTSSYAEITRQTFTVVTGEQILNLTSPFMFGVDHCIGFNDYSNTATWLYASKTTSNPIAGGWVGRASNGSWSSKTEDGDLCIGVLVSAGLGSNYVKKINLQSDYSSSKESAPTSFLLNRQHGDLYGVYDNDGGAYDEIIPYGEGNKWSNGLDINPTNNGQWFYENQNILRGKKISGVKAKFDKAGTFSILIGKNIGTNNFTYTVAHALSVVEGVNELVFSPITLNADESLGFVSPTDNVRFWFSEANKPNSIGGGFRGGKSTALVKADLCIGVFVGEPLNELIPFSGLTDRDSVLPAGQWFYENHSVMNGKFINKLKINISTAGTMSVLFAKNVGSSGYTYTKQVFNVSVGINELSILRQLESNETVGFFDYDDTAKFKFGGVNAGDKKNNIGGGFISISSNGAWRSNVLLYDLSIGVFTGGNGSAISGDINKINARLKHLEEAIQAVNPDYTGLLRDKTFSVLGDSISTYQGIIPSGHPYKYPNFGITDWRQTWWGLLTTDKYGMKLVANASWSGGTVTDMVDGSLPNYISKLGVNPDYIFLFGGTNDFGQCKTIGDLNFYDTFDRKLFIQAVCYQIEKIQETYTNAKIVYMTPMQRNYAAQSNSKNPNKVRDSKPFLYEYCDAIKMVCKIYGVQVVDMFNCGIHFYNMKYYMPDNLHPNVRGMEVIANYVYKNVSLYAERNSLVK